MHDFTLNKKSVIFVTGLSGAGKASILRVLEDLGYELVDNAPLQLIDDIVEKVNRPIAIGIDSRTSGFEVNAFIQVFNGLKRNASLQVELVYATAETDVLLRRYTATRRRHPMAAEGTVKDGVRAEIALMNPLRAVADLVIDTSDLPPSELRLLVETRYKCCDQHNKDKFTLTLMSFAFPSGIPREADMVFDARFLHNPYYVSELSSLTGLDVSIQQYVKNDPDYEKFVDQVYQLLTLVFPRFLIEGKKYVTIAVGCSGGRHRSVTVVEDLVQRIVNSSEQSMRFPALVIHRELARQGIQTWRWVAHPEQGK